MYFVKVEKTLQNATLEFYDSSLNLLESESFEDLYTLNFHFQTLASKHNISEALIIVHDKESGKVNLSIAKEEKSFFVS